MNDVAGTRQSLLLKIAALEHENVKLRKINDALITRVESSAGQLDPYSTFEHSVHLAQQVTEKTKALNQTLAVLESTNQALSEAKLQSDLFRQRFIDAIESINDAFVLLDEEGRIVLKNKHFSDFWRDSNLPIEEGVNLNDLKNLAKVRGVIRQAYPGDVDSSPVYQLADGRWFQLSEKRTSEGGWVMLYTDITALKMAETVRYEQVVEQKSTLLQNLIDNISQGVVLVSSNKKIEIWNSRFEELSQLSAHILRSSPVFDKLHRLTEIDLQSKSSNPQDYYVQILSDGTVLEIRDHLLLSGQRIKTFTDITQRHQYAESLKKSKNWLHLITDNVPAMIAYIGRDLCFQFTNRVYLDWYGLAPNSLDGVALKASRTGGDYYKLQPYVEQVLAGSSVSFEIEECDSNNNISYLLKSYVANKDSENVVLGFFVLIRNVTDRRNSALALQRAHDELERRVSARTFELRSVNKKLLQEVEERRKVQSNLVSAKHDAQQATISKTKFVAAVSHDLLQPLNAAQLFTSSIADMIKAPNQKKLIGSLANSLDDLESLICTLVDISKLDAGVVSADKYAFDLGELLHNLAHEYRQIAPQYGVQMRYVKTTQIVHSDSFLLARILRNFISNALRYTGKGKVLLGCRRRGDSVLIEVWDNGVGMSPAEIEVVFQEFKRLKHSSKAFSNGLGLGLAIVDKLSTVLEHPVSVRSVIGRGSVFSVQVPLGVLLPRASADQANETIANGASLNNRKIWVLDNDASICEGMATLLGSWGCVVVVANDFTQLGEKVRVNSDAVDLIILDYHLNNGETGLMIADSINQQRDAKVPMLMITANYAKSLKSQVNKQGILLLNKPVKPMKLKTSMLYLLKS